MQSVLDVISSVNSAVSSFVWGPVMLSVFLIIGLYFSARTKFFQIRNCKLWFSKTFLAMFKNPEIRKGDKNSISQFAAVSTSLAATIGTGSVVGVAGAIILGGAGSVFWMWVSSLLGMMTAYAENVLGIKYRYKNEKGQWMGGAMVYIEKGLNMRWLACIFSGLCVFSSLGIGNMTQANSIAYAASDLFGVSKGVTGIILVFLIGFIVIGGIKRISSLTEKFIPVIAALYLLGCVAVILVNFKSVPTMFGRIFGEAFSLRSAAGGAFGSLMLRGMRFGISRGVFSNEAGLGTSVTIHCAGEVKEPCEMGMWSIFEVFVDTMLVCTLTAFCILSSGADTSGSLNAVSLTCASFAGVLGSFGGLFVNISVIFFSLATLMSGSYLGEKSVEFLFGSQYSKYYRAVYILLIFVGCVMDLELVWSVTDTFNGLLAIPNLFAIAVLSPKVFEETKKYLKKYQKNPIKTKKFSYRYMREEFK